jgi:hypothetical protein
LFRICIEYTLPVFPGGQLGVDSGMLGWPPWSCKLFVETSVNRCESSR